VVSDGSFQVNPLWSRSERHDKIRLENEMSQTNLHRVADLYVRLSSCPTQCEEPLPHNL
jgi:hypothetical protein